MSLHVKPSGAAASWVESFVLKWAADRVSDPNG